MKDQSDSIFAKLATITFAISPPTTLTKGALIGLITTTQTLSIIEDFFKWRAK
jgi:hypothetical protein